MATTRGGRSLVRQAMLAITDHIKGEALRAGDELPGEAHFASRLGVSRAVMREAFQALAALNRIEVANGRKPRVATIDGSVLADALDHAVSTAQVSVAQVWEVRRTLEVRTAALAASHRTADEAANLVRIVEAMMRDADDMPVMTGHDIAFHRMIARVSGNELFNQIIASFVPLMQVAVPAAWRTREAPAQRRTILSQHMDVARAICVGDPGAASAAMEAHFDTSIGDLLAIE
jgi:DNA-binding FadR family transcriptional regulator